MRQLDQEPSTSKTYPPADEAADPVEFKPLRAPMPAATAIIRPLDEPALEDKKSSAKPSSLPPLKSAAGASSYEFTAGRLEKGF